MKYADNLPNPNHPQKIAKFCDVSSFFCTKCLIHDTYFRGGGSWAADLCPECGGYACRAWKSLSDPEKEIAGALFDKMRKNRL